MLIDPDGFNAAADWIEYDSSVAMRRDGCSFLGRGGQNYFKIHGWRFPERA
jgi:hypothetical protein